MKTSANRKYLQLYHDILSIINKLSNEQAGILIKAIYEYSINNKNLPANKYENLLQLISSELGG